MNNLNEIIEKEIHYHIDTYGYELICIATNNDFPVYAFEDIKKIYTERYTEFGNILQLISELIEEQHRIVETYEEILELENVEEIDNVENYGWYWFEEYDKFIKLG